MGLDINLKLDGFLSDLRAMADAVGDDSFAVEDALKAGAQPILKDMQHRTTIDPKMRSGNLNRSLSIGAVKYRRHYAGKSITIGARYTGKKKERAPHAHLVEFGHAGPKPDSMPTPAHPFLRPAFDANKEEAYQIIRDRIKLEIDKF